MPEHRKYIENIKKTILPISELTTSQLDGFRSAAVLVPIIYEEGQFKLIFIHRSEVGGLHSGEVSFPGGAVEASDTNLVDTALRESEEEIGIPPATVEILGFLPPLVSVTNYHVTPIVGLVQWPQKLTLDHHEVMRAFTIEIEWLRNQDNWQEREVDLKVIGKVKSIFFEEYEGEILWGLTARVTQNLLNRI